MLSVTTQSEILLNSKLGKLIQSLPPYGHIHCDPDNYWSARLTEWNHKSEEIVVASEPLLLSSAKYMESHKLAISWQKLVKDKYELINCVSPPSLAGQVILFLFPFIIISPFCEIIKAFI